MQSRTLFLSLISILTCFTLSARDITGRVVCGKSGVAGVVVTDGLNSTQSDKKGKFKLPERKGARYISISTPATYQSPRNEQGEIYFYHQITPDQKSYDFELERKEVDDNHHSFVVVADPQLYAEKNYDELQFRVDDIRNTVEAAGLPCHGMTAGDIVGNDPTMYPRYNNIMASSGVEFRTAIGNHDLKFNYRSNNDATEQFEGSFGPAHYSFNVGQIHYIVLNNVFYLGRGWLYAGYIDDEQLEWLAGDLSYIPEGSTIVVMMHMPTTRSENLDAPYNNGTTCDYMANSQALYKAVEGYTTHIISGHTHVNANYVISDSIFEHNVAGLCGAWWQGPLCTDGTPAGYQFFEIDGQEFKWYYKSAGYPRDMQMKVYAACDLADLGDKVIANVWNYDRNWSVEISVDGAEPVAMQKSHELDVDATKLYRNNPEIEYTWIGPTYSDHTFSYIVPASAKSVEVIATDRFGRVYKEKKELNK